MNTDDLGDPLPSGAIARLGTIRFRTGAIIDSVSVSPDGGLLVCQDRKGSIHLFDANRGLTQAFFKPNDQEVFFTKPVFTGETDLIACQCHEGIQIRHANTGQLMGKLLLPIRHCWDVKGKLVASVNIDGANFLTIRDWSTGKKLHVINMHRHLTKQEAYFSMNTIAFAADAGTIATAGNEAPLEIWDVRAGRFLRRLTESNQYLTCMVFSPDGKILAAADGDGVVRLWEIESGQLLHRIQADAKRVAQIRFSPNGNVLVSCGSEKVMRRFDPRTGKGLPDIKTGEAIECLAFAPDGQKLFSGGYGHTIRQWDLKSGAEIGNPSRLNALVFSGDGKNIITGGDTIRLWEASTAKLVGTLQEDSDGACSLALKGDGTTLAAGNMNGKVDFWDLTAGKRLSRLDCGKSWVTAIAFSPNGQILASGGFDDVFVHLWEVATGKKSARLKHLNWIIRVVFSPNGKFLVSAENDAPSPDGESIPSIRVWDWVKGKQIVNAKLAQPALSLSFSPDSKTVAFCEGQKIHFWDALGGAEPRCFAENEQTVNCVSFSPDGNFLASGGYDIQVRIWEVKTGRRVEEFRGHLAPVRHVCFSPDGTRLASVSDDTTALIWQCFANKK